MLANSKKTAVNADAYTLMLDNYNQAHIQPLQAQIQQEQMMNLSRIQA
jgi:hypothetical protein